MLDEEMWKDFVQHRKEIKKPLTKVAEKRLKKQLERWMTEGQDVNLLLEKSIINGWQGVFPDKQQGRPMAHKPYQEEPETLTTPQVARQAVRASLTLLRGGK